MSSRKLDTLVGFVCTSAYFLIVKWKVRTNIETLPSVSRRSLVMRSVRPLASVSSALLGDELESVSLCEKNPATSSPVHGLLMINPQFYVPLRASDITETLRSPREAETTPTPAQ